MLTVGRMDRRIEIEYPLRTKGTTGEDLSTWTNFCRIWATAKPLRAAERFVAGEERASKAYSFIIRYRKDIGPEMRIKFDEEYYRITGIAEIGRREALEISAEFLEQHGGAN